MRKIARIEPQAKEKRSVYFSIGLSINMILGYMYHQPTWNIIRIRWYWAILESTDRQVQSNMPLFLERVHNKSIFDVWTAKIWQTCYNFLEYLERETIHLELCKPSQTTIFPSTETGTLDSYYLFSWYGYDESKIGYRIAKLTLC
jgi:hypothetical protein